ncbi:AAA family ATPase [Aeromicrobium sp. SMF47]|uniref:AAA family ATPase n=1 Tax=Aeromicrobium yanjiei TaxID=2662028 RepID=UPI00129D6C1B|nr:LuxR family transcriptional regulator [Aeromicrobium yanjiei]MRJ76565.1 AAA family ATPase [Aeromicrobium yanjiei]
MSDGQVLRGREKERELLDGLVTSARSGHSGVVVLTGEPGIGKSALLEHVSVEAAGCRVLRVAGVESEMELAFAGLHQMCSPLWDGAERLPEPQASALGVAFGLRAGSAPDGFLVGLAVLNLLADAAAEQPLVCLVDDAQWLDKASARVLAFVARRVAAESVVLVFAARPSDDDTWTGLREVVVHGLPLAEARALLESSATQSLDVRVRDRILGETHGNPLALLELPHLFSATELAFGPEARAPRSVTTRMEEGFRRRLMSLPEISRIALLAAAAEPLGDADLLRRATHDLGIDLAPALLPAELAGLVEMRETVGFRHPLVRSVTYWSAEPADRQAVHRALADVTDPLRDPDRRAWHRASASIGPDEEVAGELETCADRAMSHGGLSAAAAFLERAAALTAEPAVRVRRELAAAEAMLHAGTFEAALRVLAAARLAPLSDRERARADVLRAQIGFAVNRGNEALPLLLAAARRLESFDIEHALDCYLDALTAVLFAGRSAAGPRALEVAQASLGALSPASARKGDALLEGVSVLFTDGYASAVPLLRRSMDVFDSDDLSIDEGLRSLWLAAVVASNLWDDEAWNRLGMRHLEIAREVGSLSALPLALNTRVFVELFRGRLSAAAALVEEIATVDEVAESRLTPYGAIGLAAFRGHEDEAAPMMSAASKDVAARGEGIGVALTSWARALLCNGLGRYPEALQAAREAVASSERIGVLHWGLTELVEAAARAGELSAAIDACQRLSEMTHASGTEWALGVGARCEALVSKGDRAEVLFREAIDHLERTSARVEVARARLLYGEWLRREGRRRDARRELRSAHDVLRGMGLDAFAERARWELAATGERVRKRVDVARPELTPQEMHIARLAADGLTNQEIGAQLFISPRTVEWHMGKVLAKLGVTTRRHLRDALRTAFPESQLLSSS